MKELVFLERVGTAVFLIWALGSAETPKHAGIFYRNSSDGHAGGPITNASPLFLSDCDSCVSSAQLPYLLLNSTGSDPKARMYPVFFGESIEVNPKPEQEIK